MEYRIECLDAEGKTRQGTVIAESVEAATRKVKSKGLSLTSIVPVADDDAVPTVPPRPTTRSKVAPQNVAPSVVSTPTPALSTTVRGSWPITLLSTFVAFLIALILGMHRSVGILLATAPVFLIFNRGWRARCFEVVRLNRSMTAVQQCFLLGITAFCLVFSAGSPPTTTDLSDSAIEISKEKGDPKPASTPEATSSNAPGKSRPKPTSPAGLLTQRIGNTVEGVGVTVNDYFDDRAQKIVIVRWNIGNNLTESMIRASAQIDIVAILKAVRESGILTREVTVFGSFPLTDKLGNTSKEVVVKATYTSDTVRQINFENFLFKNAYEVSENSWIHPAFRN